MKYILISPEELQEIISATLKAEIPKLIHPVQDNNQNYNNEEYMSRQDAAAFLHCSLVTLYHYEKNGKLIPLRLGRKILYPKQSLINAMKGIDSS